MNVDPRSKHVPADWVAPLARWRTELRAGGRRPGTVYLRAAHIAQLARWAEGSPAELTAARVLEYLAGHDWAAETRRAVSASLRGFFQSCGRPELVAVVPSVRPVEPRPRPAPDLVVREALRRCRDPRLALAIRLAAEAGLRRGEVVAVHARHVMADLVGWSLEVQGKGGRVRVVPLPDALALELRVAAGGGWAFPSAAGGHLTAGWLGKRAGALLPAGWSFHTLRHRFATRVHDATGDLLTVQRLLGHASPATTQRYIAADGARLRAAAAVAELAA